MSVSVVVQVQLLCSDISSIKTNVTFGFVKQNKVDLQTEI